MGFSKLKTGNAAPAAPAKTTPPPPAKVVAAEVETVHVAEVEVNVEVDNGVTNSKPAANTRALAAFGSGSVAAGLLAILELADAGVPVTFPVLMLTGGNSGGAFTPASFVAQEVADQLPQGKKPVECVFMGYRTELAAWPVGFADKKEGDKPSWSVAAGCADAEAQTLVGGAAKGYQFTKGVDKGKWDTAESGIGHLRPVLQIMVYLPEVDDIIVVQTPAHYTSWTSTVANMRKLMDPKSNQLLQQPCQLRPISTAKTINGNAITEHVIDFNVVASETGQAWYKAYAAFIKTAAADAELREKIENWINCADKPMTDSIRATLTKAGSFRA